jgi:outer membrane protein assembly factor BamD (BamD/ComL family)
MENLDIDFVAEHIWERSYEDYTDKHQLHAVLNMRKDGTWEILCFDDYFDAQPPDWSKSVVVDILNKNLDPGARWFTKEEFDALLEKFPVPRYSKNARYHARLLNEPLSNFEL